MTKYTSIVFLTALLQAQWAMTKEMEVTTKNSDISMIPYTHGKEISSSSQISSYENDGYDDDDYPYDYYTDVPDLSLGGPTCRNKMKCSGVYNVLTYPDKNCYCDDACGYFGDCCADKISTQPQQNLDNMPAIELFECKVFQEIYKNEGIYVVNKCPNSWVDDRIKSFCESEADDSDVLLRLPVTDVETGTHFQNMYCASCNFKQNYLFWKVQRNCECEINDTETCLSSESDCKYSFLFPTKNTTVRKCPKAFPKSDCLKTFEGTKIAEKCRINYGLVFDGAFMYKNQFCAQCNDIPVTNLTCEPIISIEVSSARTYPPPDGRKQYSFRLIVDFSNGKGHVGNEASEIDYSQNCENNELYDPFSRRCREVLCVLPYIPQRGKCVLSTRDEKHAIDDSLLNCTYTKLEASEYKIINGSQIFIIPVKQVYNMSEVKVNGSDIFICNKFWEAHVGEKRESLAMLHADIVESWISFVGLLISVIALTLTFIIYLCFKQLRNIPGKILMNLIVSLFLAQLIFLIAPNAEEINNFCVGIAIVMHYFFLAAFCWMNMMALDLWVAFSKQFVASGSDKSSSKRFYLYCIYAWSTPLLVVLISISVNYSQIDSDFKYLKPMYGEVVCWISSNGGLLLFFVGPLALFKLFDIAAFVFTTIHICTARRHSAMAAGNHDKCQFVVYIKLSLIMGLTWVFAFIANLANIPELWYVFILFNTLQGVFICACFAFTKKVIRLVAERFAAICSRKKERRLMYASTSNQKLSASSTKSSSSKTFVTNLSKNGNSVV